MKSHIVAMLASNDLDLSKCQNNHTTLQSPPKLVSDHIRCDIVCCCLLV